MAADWTLKAGNTSPILTDSLTYSDGSVVDLTDATVTFIMRNHASNTALTLTGAVTVPTAALGRVQFVPTATDTATAGLYMANWHVTFSDASTMTFPSEGYLWVSIEESLTTTGGATLVSLPDVKDYLNIPATDRSHDAKLMRFISSVQPVVESLTGPILARNFDEWHAGGTTSIRLRRRPATGYGTSPILDLIGVVEYRGPIQYALKIVQDPAHGDTYSCMLDTYGFVTRRSTGGGTIPFASGSQSVHVFYRAGQVTVPPNVYEGTLELLRLHYQRTQQSGRSRAAAYADDDEPTGTPVGFLVPGKVRELLQPTKRAPSIA